MDIVDCIKKQRKEWDLQGYDIIFPDPYKYLNIHFNDLNHFCKWFDDNEFQKYMNFDPPIDRINGYTGNILLQYVILNNTTTKKQ